MGGSDGGRSLCEVPYGGEAVLFGVRNTGTAAAGAAEGEGDRGWMEMGACRDLREPVLLWLQDDGSDGGGGCWAQEECGVVLVVTDHSGQVPVTCRERRPRRLSHLPHASECRRERAPASLSRV